MTLSLWAYGPPKGPLLLTQFNRKKFLLHVHPFVLLLFTTVLPKNLAYCYVANTSCRQTPVRFMPFAIAPHTYTLLLTTDIAAYELPKAHSPKVALLVSIAVALALAL